MLQLCNNNSMTVNSIQSSSSLTKHSKVLNYSLNNIREGCQNRFSCDIAQGSVPIVCSFQDCRLPYRGWSAFVTCCRALRQAWPCHAVDGVGHPYSKFHNNRQFCTTLVYTFVWLSVCHLSNMPDCQDWAIDLSCVLQNCYEMTYFCGTQEDGIAPCHCKRIQVQENPKHHWDQWENNPMYMSPSST